MILSHFKTILQVFYHTEILSKILYLTCLSTLSCQLFNQQTVMHAQCGGENLGLTCEKAGLCGLFILNNHTNGSDPSMKKLWYPFVLTQEFQPQPRKRTGTLNVLFSLLFSGEIEWCEQSFKDKYGKTIISFLELVTPLWTWTKQKIERTKWNALLSEPSVFSEPLERKLDNCWGNLCTKTL